MRNPTSPQEINLSRKLLARKKKHTLPGAGLEKRTYTSKSWPGKSNKNIEKKPKKNRKSYKIYKKSWKKYRKSYIKWPSYVENPNIYSNFRLKLISWGDVGK